MRMGGCMGGKKRRSMLRLYIFREAQNIASLQRRSMLRLYIFREAQNIASLQRRATARLYFSFSIFRFQFQEGAGHVGGGVGADTLQLHEDAFLVAVFHHDALHAGEGPAGDHHMVALDEGRHLRLVDEDVVVARLDDDAEALHLSVGDDQKLVAAELVGGEVVVVGCQSGHLRCNLQQPAVVGQRGAYEQQPFVEWFRTDLRLRMAGFAAVGAVDAAKCGEVGLVATVVEFHQPVIDFLCAVVGGADGEPMEGRRGGGILYRLPVFGICKSGTDRNISFGSSIHTNTLSVRNFCHCISFPIGRYATKS